MGCAPNSTDLREADHVKGACVMRAESAIGAIWDPCRTNRCLRPVTVTLAALLRPPTWPPDLGSRPWPAWAQFWAHSSPSRAVHRWSPGSCSRGSRTVADAGERWPTLLESVLGATPREFESRILRHADLQKHAEQAPPGLSRCRGLSQFLSTERPLCQVTATFLANQEVRRAALVHSCGGRWPSEPGRPASPGMSVVRHPRAQRPSVGSTGRLSGCVVCWIGDGQVWEGYCLRGVAWPGWPCRRGSGALVVSRIEAWAGDGVTEPGTLWATATG
jgi:hypothetical protein